MSGIFFNFCLCKSMMKSWFALILLFRRLCPDISFFQQATDFPCEEIVGGPDSDSIRLHNRVQYTALSSGNVERRGIGMNKVTYIWNFYRKISFWKSVSLGVLYSEESPRRLCSFIIRARGSLGGSRTNIVYLCKIESRPELRSRNERDHRSDLLPFCHGRR